MYVQQDPRDKTYRPKCGKSFSLKSQRTCLYPCRTALASTSNSFESIAKRDFSEMTRLVLTRVQIKNNFTKNCCGELLTRFNSPIDSDSEIKKKEEKKKK